MSEENRKRLLIVEDDPGLQKQLSWCFSDYELAVAEDCESALVQLRRHQPGVVTLDLGLPPDPANASVGLATLSQILVAAPRTKVIVVTGNDDRENAMKAVALGAYDFYQKPIDPDVLSLIVQRAYHLHELEAEHYRQSERNASPLEGIIASSPSMLKVLTTVEKVAPTSATVLLLGESGTGKELLARAVHDLSPRKEERFVAINCAAIPDQLLESELFGYERGAFTGANKQTIGKLEYANGGTLFLDEVGDLPLPLQAKMLRFLQERVIERLGGREEIPVDVRVVCATHKDLKTLVKEEAFREDLYYRINAISVAIPPLRERAGDPLLIARAILQQMIREHGGRQKEFSQDAIRAIEAYAWPGNVRELENKVKRAVIMAGDRLIEPEDLELEPAGNALPATLRAVREQAEAEAVRRALIRFEGNIARAAEILDVSRPTMYHFLKKYGIEV